MSLLMHLLQEKLRPLAAFISIALLANASPSFAQQQLAPFAELGIDGIDGAAIDSALVKVLTAADDSGRNGVSIPAAAWSFFPSIKPAGEDSTCSITTIWQDGQQTRTEPTVWKSDARTATRRLVSLGSQRLNTKPLGSLLVLARYRNRENMYAARVLYPGDPVYQDARRWSGLDAEPMVKGAFALFRKLDAGTTASTPALRAFLTKFDHIKSRGFVTTLRSGSTGIGYTLETLLELEENNDPRGDFQGMELKAYRDDENTLDDKEKMNLFLKEPTWLDGLKSADRIAAYGYVDKNGRTALYSTVTVRQNSHGFCFDVDEPGQKLFLIFKGKRVAAWDFATLQNRLSEKHTEAAFVAARTRGKGKGEQFHYHAVTWCSRPSIESMLALIKSRNVMLELRMHVKENGAARNHGTAFRVHKNKLPELYSVTVRCRG